jgi:uncharacterized membrane protein (DUF485 family)
MRSAPVSSLSNVKVFTTSSCPENHRCRQILNFHQNFRTLERQRSKIWNETCLIFTLLVQYAILIVFNKINVLNCHFIISIVGKRLVLKLDYLITHLIPLLYEMCLNIVEKMV